MISCVCVCECLSLSLNRSFFSTYLFRKFTLSHSPLAKGFNKNLFCVDLSLNSRGCIHSKIVYNFANRTITRSVDLTSVLVRNLDFELKEPSKGRSKNRQCRRVQSVLQRGDALQRIREYVEKKRVYLKRIRCV